MKHLTWRAINFVKNNGAANAIAPYAAISCKAQQLVGNNGFIYFAGIPKVFAEHIQKRRGTYREGKVKRRQEKVPHNVDPMPPVNRIHTSLKIEVSNVLK